MVRFLNCALMAPWFPGWRLGTPWMTVVTTVWLATVAAVLSVGCSAAAPTSGGQAGVRGFAIYLPAAEITAQRMLNADLDDLELQEAPVLTSDDIISYDGETHEMALTPLAAERIGALDVPTSGRPFVVCVDGQPIYSGAFWVSLSSLSYPGVVIDTLPAQMERPIRIQLGYPESLGLFAGPDPRSHPKIIESLIEAGKLK